MPLYTVITQADVLSGNAKAKLAGELTAFHSEYAGVPKNWIHIVFQDYAPGSGLHRRGAGGDGGAHASYPNWPVAGIQARVTEARLWELLQDATGAPDDQIVLGIQEVPPSQAMEMGQITPDASQANDAPGTATEWRMP